MIDAKIEGQDIVAPEIEEPPRVVNLMEALRRSLDEVGTAKKKPAKAAGSARAAAARADRSRARGATRAKRSA
jgi:DNA end-binding protein Ku